VIANAIVRLGVFGFYGLRATIRVRPTVFAMLPSCACGEPISLRRYDCGQLIVHVIRSHPAKA
jgi:hypothetical protein